METLLYQKVCKINTFICTDKINPDDYQPIIQEQNNSFFSGTIVPLSVTIFCAEPWHKRIFTSIGARLEVL
ncbi:hypothetical protein [Flavobacterium hydatis]|uniref:Uncharacterized protein n=1 Tax=Flavobacterium hydatis TaxID=991 RepID=A0A085ZZT3_FLAHY|nr:hypothetical protein [Flavobacterium hydatis]KFF09947.1 hypothetical protein IW20_21885 [Flavobacterium hydatis]OXA95285.1 hypothetical protein B0A62_08210 [Flavobacterium hydatis]